MICSILGLSFIQEIKNKDLAFEYFENLICKYNITTFLLADEEDIYYEFCYIFFDFKKKYPNLKFFSVNLREIFCKPKFDKFDYSLLMDFSDICLIYFDKNNLNIPLKFTDLFLFLEKTYVKLKDNKNIIFMPKSIIK